MPAPYTGGCLCGEIRYRLSAEPLVLYACHCTDCQRQSATAFNLSMPVAREIYQEGLLLPPVKLARRGRIVRDILDLVLANVRTPDEREGDLNAQIAANRVAETRLRDTVERFNGFARRGRDEDFHRGDHVYSRWLGDSLDDASPTLGAIEKSPFFAIPVYPGDVSTFGGILTDEHARALRNDGTVIPGLYATGTSTASVMGYIAPGAGGSIGPSFTWGFVAAKHAAGSA